MNKIWALIPILMLVLVVSGCTTTSEIIDYRDTSYPILCDNLECWDGVEHTNPNVLSMSTSQTLLFTIKILYHPNITQNFYFNISLLAVNNEMQDEVIDIQEYVNSWFEYEDYIVIEEDQKLGFSNVTTNPNSDASAGNYLFRISAYTTNNTLFDFADFQIEIIE